MSELSFVNYCSCNVEKSFIKEKCEKHSMPAFKISLSEIVGLKNRIEALEEKVKELK